MNLKRIICMLTVFALPLAFSNFANANTIRHYNELSPLQQKQYDMLTETEKSNTKEIFGFTVYGKENAYCNCIK